MVFEKEIVKFPKEKEAEMCKTNVENVENVDKKAQPVKRRIYREKRELRHKKLSTFRKKISTVSVCRLGSWRCGYCGKLNSKKVFTDFKHVTGSHSYQQVAVYAIFQ